MPIDKLIMSHVSLSFSQKEDSFFLKCFFIWRRLSPIEDLAGGAMRIQPFFSRRIGLDANARPVPIEVGARMVYRSEKRNFGAIAIRQNDGGSMVIPIFL